MPRRPQGRGARGQRQVVSFARVSRKERPRMAVAPLPAPTSTSHLTPVHRLGEQAFDLIAEVGDMATFATSTLAWLVRRRARWTVLVPTFYAIGVSSVPVVAITGTFIGMVLAVQAHSSFSQMGLETRLGSV